MSLIPCKECGQSVSRKAASCPHCGHPLRRRLRVGFVLRMAITLAALYLAYKFVLPILQQAFKELSRP